MYYLPPTHHDISHPLSYDVSHPISSSRYGNNRSAPTRICAPAEFTYGPCCIVPMDPYLWIHTMDLYGSIPHPYHVCIRMYHMYPYLASPPRCRCIIIHGGMPLLPSSGMPPTLLLPRSIYLVHLTHRLHLVHPCRHPRTPHPARMLLIVNTHRDPLLLNNLHGPNNPATCPCYYYYRIGSNPSPRHHPPSTFPCCRSTIIPRPHSSQPHALLPCCIYR